jgi:hypothetical protein
MRPTILPDGHPAQGINLAWYLFSVGSDRLLWVLADRMAKVELIEWTVLQGLLTPKCQMRARVSPTGTEDVVNVGIRGENDDLASYVDFMFDMVDLTNIQEIFAETLTQDDRTHLVERLETASEASETSIAMLPPARPEVAQERLVGALTGLGFNKGQVKNFVGRVGNRLGVEKIENLIREGIQQLS